MNNVLKCAAAFAVVMMGAASAHAMTEYGLNEVVLNKTTGCWLADDGEVNYGVVGKVRGDRYLYVKMQPAQELEVAAVGPMTPVGSFNVQPKFFETATGKDAGEFLGMTTDGFAAFWVPKAVDYTIIYYSNFERRETYEGLMDVCVRTKK